MPANRKRWVLALCSYIGFLLGLFTAALGPSLGELAKRNGAELGAMGSVFTALFVGALLAQLASGPLSDARGRRAVLVGGLALLAAGASALCLSTALPLALAAVVVAGLGHGSSDLMILVLAAKTYPEKSVSALNILGLLFGAGAFVGPALVGLSQRLSGSALPVLWFAAAAHALAVPLVLAVLEPESAKPGPVAGAAEEADAAKTRDAKPAQAQGDAKAKPVRGALSSPYVWILGLLLLVYVGAENAMGGWMAEYYKLTTGASAPEAAVVVSLFWLALSAGRLAAAAAGTKLSPRAVLGLGIGVALAGALLLALSPGVRVATLAAIVVTGFGYSSIYPTGFAMAAAAFPDAPGKATSLVTVLGSAGGMLLPLLEGFVLAGAGPRAAGPFMLALGLLMLLLFAAAAARPKASRLDREGGAPLAS